MIIFNFNERRKANFAQFLGKCFVNASVMLLIDVD